MIEDYKLGQPLFFKIISNSIINKKISHAYLIETNSCSYALDLAIAFSKTLICSNNYINCHNCGDCHICQRIDHNNFSELKIIKPDGLWIKKDQLLELQEEFTKKSIESQKRVYIIYEAEKMNKQAANSMLKFLEEPEENIIAILITNNVNLLLDTIVSRCQIICLRKEVNNLELNNDNDESLLMKIGNFLFKNKEEIKNYVNNPNSIGNINGAIEFIEYYEENKIDTILKIKKLWLDKFKSKEENIIAFEIIIQFYYDVLNYMNDQKINTFVNQKDTIVKIAEKNKIKTIIKNVETYIKYKDIIKYNVNINSVLDKLIIELGGE